METGDAVLLLGLGALMVYVMRKQQDPRVVYVEGGGRFFRNDQEIQCPQTVLSMCPGGMPRCYSDGSLSCDAGGFRRDLSDVMATMESFCVQNPHVCVQPKVGP